MSERCKRVGKSRNDRWLQSTFSCIYLTFSALVPPLSPPVSFSIGNFDMADVSDPRIQQGAFPNNVEQTLAPVVMMLISQTKLCFHSIPRRSVG